MVLSLGGREHETAPVRHTSWNRILTRETVLPTISCALSARTFGRAMAKHTTCPAMRWTAADLVLGSKKWEGGSGESSVQRNSRLHSREKSIVIRKVQAAIGRPGRSFQRHTLFRPGNVRAGYRTFGPSEPPLRVSSFVLDGNARSQRSFQRRSGCARYSQAPGREFARLRSSPVAFRSTEPTLSKTFSGMHIRTMSGRLRSRAARRA